MPRHIMDSVIALYFERVHGRPYAFFHRNCFLKDFGHGMIPNYLSLSVFATAIRFSEDPFFSGKNHQVSDTFSYKAWQQIIEQYLVREDAADLTVIQAVTLLAIVEHTGNYDGVHGSEPQRLS